MSVRTKEKQFVEYFGHKVLNNELVISKFTSRNMKQILHIYEECIANDYWKGITPLFKHSIIQKEILRYKREIRRRVKTTKGKDRLRNIKILKF